jgi:molybdopterin synthase catalytic subunit
VDALDVDAVLDVIEDQEPYETLESLVATVKRSPNADRAGAIATFTGRVRAKDHPDDERTEYLEFEKYEGVAERRMREIETDLSDRDGVLDVRLHHRTGVVEAGEDIVFVVVLAGHRNEAFRTVEDGINRLKDEVPLFKKEVTTDETFWVHERE